MSNPLFANDTDDKRNDSGYALGKRHAGRIEPLHKDVRLGSEYRPPEAAHGSRHHEASANTPQPKTGAEATVGILSPGGKEKSDNPAIDLIRRKLDALFANEPAAEQEIKEAEQSAAHRSKHQQFMYDLSTSGKSLAEIQTAWHNYYVSLPDHEKHEVWQEFYDANARRPSPYAQFVGHHKPAATDAVVTSPHHREPEQEQAFAVTPPALPRRNRRTATAIRRSLLNRVSLETQHKAKHHLKSLAFGLASGALVLLIFLFGFFNELVIAPLIQPSRAAAETPIILNTDGIAPTDQNEVIIPKLNVQIPIDFSIATTNENAIENSLQSGVVHYPTTVMPGQQGNTAFFGHSSNNIFASGKYKYAFVLLHTLVPGDIFYITYSGKVYSYKVYQKAIVEPSDVSVLGNVPGHVATATLITCDPPGTSLHRLVVWADQVSPDPASNTAASTPAVTTPPATLPSNGPTLWSRFIHWLF